MSPILTRPIREQFEHDRIIRLLQARYRRKFEVAINLGPDQNTPVSVGEQSVFPDLVLFSQDRGHKLQGTVEVETGESVNTLEAMSQWALFSRLRAPFALYVPPSSLDTARRLCVEHNIAVSEIWTYHTALDQVRFTMVQQTEVPAAKTQPKAAAAPAAKPVVKEAVPAAQAQEAKSPKEAKPAAARATAAAKAAKPMAKTTSNSRAGGTGKGAKPAAKKPAAKAVASRTVAARPAAKAGAGKTASKAAASKAAPKAAKRKLAPPAKRR